MGVNVTCFNFFFLSFSLPFPPLLLLLLVLSSLLDCPLLERNVVSKGWSVWNVVEPTATNSAAIIRKGLGAGLVGTGRIIIRASVMDFSMGHFDLPSTRPSSFCWMLLLLLLVLLGRADDLFLGGWRWPRPVNLIEELMFTISR